MGIRTKSPNLLVMACSSWGPALLDAIQEPTKTASLEQKTHSYNPGNSKEFRSSVSETRVKDQSWEQKMLLVLLSLRKLLNYKGFKNSVPESKGIVAIISVSYSKQELILDSLIDFSCLKKKEKFLISIS